ncbi:ParA family protein [Lactiplantibacillus plantarum]|uniref:ParA family protein n=1 Tax=Lactiplantibacillus plantarum TaxID=1590 RepID=UPI0007BB43BF|nr:AAA family ATPase [Lactiplantibacillus plantarum]KZU18601.1 Chromosome partitioning protein ParA [Lactiplantibacillus plantarum]
MDTNKAKATVISFPMQKGGVGKTTTSRNVAGILSQNYKVLAIDNDQNADLTDTFTSKRIVEQTDQPTIYDIYINKSSINDVKMKITDNLDLVPANITLANVDVELSSKLSREFILKKAIAEVASEYDYVIIDCSPSLNITTINALVASDYTVYVTQLEYFSMQAINQLQKTVNLVKEINPTLKELGLILTMADDTNHVRDIKQELGESEYKLLGTINRATLVRDANMAKQAVFEFSKKHKVARQYQVFVDNLLSKMED